MTSIASQDHIIEAGFWVGYSPASLCDQFLPGDATMAIGIWPAQAIGSDVTYLVNYLRNQPTSVPCLLGGLWASADVNGDCSVSGGDVTRLVNYLRGAIGVTWCADYEPAWPTPLDIPAERPAGWPGCETTVLSSRILPTGSSGK